MIYLQQFILNSVFITALIGWCAAQVLKIVFSWDSGFDFKRIVGSGGMPSSHAAFVMALSFAVGFTEGFDSAVIVKDLIKADYSHTNRKLKELLGHTPIEVFAGAVLGIIIAIIRHV